MALTWPIDTEGVMPLSFDAVRLIEEALAERFVASGASRVTKTIDRCAGPGAPGQPLLSRIVAIRDALCALAPCFVEWGRDDYAWSHYAKFPRCYEAADLLRGEHSLAALPPFGAYEFDEDATELYRTFVANAVWWLRKFRYVVADESWWARRLTAGGVHVKRWSNDPNGTPDDRETGDPLEVVLADPTRTSGKYTTTTRCRMRLYRSIYRYDAHFLATADDPITGDSIHNIPVTITGYRRQEAERIDNAVYYCDLRVVNPTGIGADVKLVAKTAGNHPAQTDHLSRTDEVRTEWNPTRETSRRAPGGGGVRPRYVIARIEDRFYTHDRVRNELVGGEYRMTEEDFYSGKQNDFGTVRQIRQRWSEDGSEMVVDSDETTPVDWMSFSEGTLGSYERTDHDPFDGFGDAAAPGVFATGSVDPHATARFLQEESSIPFPDCWDAVNQLPTQNTDEKNRVYEAYLDFDIVPVLDFGTHYTKR